MDVLQWSRSGRVALGEVESDLTVKIGTIVLSRQWAQTINRR